MCGLDRGNPAGAEQVYGTAVPAPVTAPSSGNGKLWGAIGVVGCLAIVGLAALVGAGGVAFFLAFASVPAVSGPPSSSGPAMRTSTHRELGLRAPARSAIRQDVGGSRLISTAPVTKYPEKLVDAVVDSAGAFYSAPDGSQLVFMVLTYPTADIAQRGIEAVTTTLQEMPGAGVVEPGKVVDFRGVTLGLSLLNQESRQHMYWSNGTTVMIISGNAPHAVRFFESFAN